jgi:hypothetical protein
MIRLLPVLTSIYCFHGQRGIGLDIHAAALGGWVPEFVRVSNRMAGITRAPTAAEIGAHRGLLAANALTIKNLELFISHVAPGAAFRDAPEETEDGEATTQHDLKEDLATIVDAARTHSSTAARLHRIYRQLRPFTDGNGRCGRALWMWQLMRGAPEEIAELTRLDLLDPRHPLSSDARPRSTMM